MRLWLPAVSAFTFALLADIATGRLLWKSPTDAGEGIWDLALSPDGKVPVYDDGGKFSVRDTDANHDGTIEVSELASYLKDRVPELSFKAFAVRQTPEVKISGGDFSLVKRVAPDAPAR